MILEKNQLHGGSGRTSPLTEITHELYILKVSSIRASKDDHNTDGILINKLDGIRWMHNKICFRANWNEACFDIPVPS